MQRYGQTAYERLRQLSFTRVSGSAEETRAAAWIAAQIEAIGYPAAIETFTYKRSVPLNAALEADGVSYEVTGFIDSGDTPPEGITAEFLYVRAPDEFTLKRAHGKFVLLKDRLDEKTYGRLVRAGIVGYAVMSGTIRDTRETSDLETQRLRESLHAHGKVPAFTLRMADAVKLLQQKPASVHFTLAHREEAVTSRNVVTTVPGTDLKEEAFAVGAHYDSVPFSQGAWDNGAGVVQVLGLLDYFRQNPPRRTVRAVLFGSEETGLRGSRAYLEAHPQEQDALLGMINLDVGGNILGSELAFVTATESAEAYLRAICREAGYPLSVSGRVMSSDSAVFADYGIPAIGLGQMTPRGGGYMHTRYDSFEWIDADVLGEEVRFLTVLASRLANAECFPIQRVIAPALREEIKRYFGKGFSHTETVKEFPEEEKDRPPFRP